jgi:hypothetical protein
MDTIPPFVLLVFALVLLALAGGLGFWLYNYITGGGTGNGGHERPLVAETSARGKATMGTDAQELLSVRRTKRGDLVVFVQGARYHHLREIKDPQLGKETVEAIRCVLAFAEGWLPSLRQEPSQPPPAGSSVDEEAFLERLRQSDMFSLEAPSSGPFGRRSRGGRRPFQPLEPLLTPADAINELVQQRLQERPDMARQIISITTGADGGLRIRVGLKTFTEAGAIPDPEARALVQDAIREWKEG